MKYLERLRVGTADIHREFAQKVRNGFTVTDVGEAARDLSALWETSLKACGRSWTGHYLFHINADLAGMGWAGHTSLDALRQINNDAKHGQVTATGDEVLAALTQLEGSIAALNNIVPELQTEFNETRQRQIVCAIYDVLTQGETVFSFLSAAPEDTAQTVQRVDDFQLNYQDEAAARVELEALPGWEYAPARYEQLALSLTESDHEFWKLAVFTCPYPDAQRILAQRQHDRDLLPGLHREDDSGNVLASLALAQSSAWALVGQLLSTDDLLAAAHADGLTTRHPESAGFAKDLTAVLASALPNVAPNSVDRASHTTFSREVARGPAAMNAQLGVLVTPEGVVLVRT